MIPLAAAIWLNLGGLTYHLDHRYDGRNPGLGIEYPTGDLSFAAAGFYRNSEDRTSRYIIYGDRLFVTDRIAVGYIAGAVTGYRRPIPTAAPVMTWEGDHVGMNFIYLPPMDGIAAQFKIRLQ